MAEKEIPVGADLNDFPTIGVYKPDSRLAEAFQKAMEESPHVLVITEKPSWIPCSERLPEKEGQYLVTTITEKVHLWSFYFSLASKRPYFSGDEKVVAWMPMPEAYKWLQKEANEDDET